MSNLEYDLSRLTLLGPESSRDERSGTLAVSQVFSFIECPPAYRECISSTHLLSIFMPKVRYPGKNRVREHLVVTDEVLRDEFMFWATKDEIFVRANDVVLRNKNRVALTNLRIYATFKHLLHQSKSLERYFSNTLLNYRNNSRGSENSFSDLVAAVLNFAYPSTTFPGRRVTLNEYFMYVFNLHETDRESVKCITDAFHPIGKVRVFINSFVYVRLIIGLPAYQDMPNVESVFVKCFYVPKDTLDAGVINPAIPNPNEDSTQNQLDLIVDMREILRTGGHQRCIKVDGLYICRDVGYIINDGFGDPCVMPLINGTSSFPGKMSNEIFVYFNAGNMSKKMILNEHHKKIILGSYESIKLKVNKIRIPSGDALQERNLHSSQFSLVCHVDAFDQFALNHIRMIPPVISNLFSRLSVADYCEDIKTYIKADGKSTYIQNTNTLQELASKSLYMIRTLVISEANYLIAMRRDPASVPKIMEKYRPKIEVATSLFPLSVYASAVRAVAYLPNRVFWMRVFFIYVVLFFRRGASRLFLRKIIYQYLDIEAESRDWNLLLSDERLWVATMNYSYLLLEADPLAFKSAYYTLSKKSDTMLVHRVPYIGSGVDDPRILRVDDDNEELRKIISIPRHLVINFTRLIPGIRSSANEYGLEYSITRFEGAGIFNDICREDGRPITSLTI